MRRGCAPLDNCSLTECGRWGSSGHLSVRLVAQRSPKKASGMPLIFAECLKEGRIEKRSMAETQQNAPTHGIDSFAAMFESSDVTASNVDLGGEGQIVAGIVVQVNRDTVVVDIGGKSEGVINLDEFRGADGSAAVKAGDRVDVFIESRENDDGLISLSKEKADKMKVWDEISSACERDEIIEGTISQRVKGGPLCHHPRWRKGVSPGVAGRSSADPQPRQVDWADLRVQGHQVQQEARQHRALAPSSPRARAG